MQRVLKGRYQTSIWPEIGIDEVGRGCLAGPVVAAAVFLPRNFPLSGLADSKALNKSSRISLAQTIRAKALAWGIGEASVEEIDQHNILEATWLAMHRAIDTLLSKSNFNKAFLLIDGNKFKPYRAFPSRCIVRGDSTFASIASASILAKTYRDAHMVALSHSFPKYSWEKNVGYPTYFHREAIRQHGLTEHHRHSFRCLNP